MNPSQRRWLGEPPYAPGGGLQVYLGTNLQDAVVFLGFKSGGPSGFTPIGTGFLVGISDVAHVVTARHVAEVLGRDPFLIRFNRGEGDALVAHADNREWVYHPDEAVDVAAFQLSPQDREVIRPVTLFGEDLLLSAERRRKLDINVGCFCYVVGLFRFLEGTKRNTPITYTGHIASLQLDEAVMSWNEKKKAAEPVHVFLIQCHGVRGISGAPVFVRQTKGMTYPVGDEKRTSLWAANEVDLLGVFSAAWFLPPDHPLRETYKTREGDTVPVGIGMVVPCERLIELLDVPALKQPRDEIIKARSAKPT